MASTPARYPATNDPSETTFNEPAYVDDTPPVIGVILVLALIGVFGMLVGGGITWAVIRLLTC